ncbi:MAG: hypothetical protein ACJAT5_000301 [Lentimonas sp.]|jgi:hypothetical protein
MKQYPSKTRIINRLYKELDGFTCSSEVDDKRFFGSNASVYGELTPLGTQQLLNYLQLSEEDVFYDLGSGVGKINIQIGMTVSIKKCVGVELMYSRWKESSMALEEARSQNLLITKNVQFYNESFLESDITDASVIYIASTCYSSTFMDKFVRKIKTCTKPVKVVTLRDFNRNHRGFQFIENIDLNVSWTSSVTACVYSFTPVCR